MKKRGEKKKKKGGRGKTEHLVFHGKEGMTAIVMGDITGGLKKIC